MARTVTMKGNPLTLDGAEVKTGDAAPDFSSLAGPGSKKTLSDFAGKVKIFNVVVSVDTPVCDVQTKRFSDELKSLPDNVEVVTVSMDLPFAQSRYVKEACIEGGSFLSDHSEASFGKSYGVLMKENRLLARAVFVVDENDVVRHAEYVKEITDEPDYEAVLSAVKAL
ncbi:thiol peroxidase [Candidatus Mycalebacterium sp.]